MIPFSKTQFLSQIVDYENNHRWNYRGEKPCILIFWKNDYAFNQMLFDCIEKIENRFSEKIDFYSVDVEQEPLLSADLGIRKIPTWLLVPKNKPAKMIQGIPTDESILLIIKDIL